MRRSTFIIGGILIAALSIVSIWRMRGMDLAVADVYIDERTVLQSVPTEPILLSTALEIIETHNIYSVDLKLKGQRFIGTENIKYTHDFMTATNSIWLKMGTCEINSIYINGEEMSFSKNQGICKIELGYWLQSMESIDIVVEFTGYLPCEEENVFPQISYFKEGTGWQMSDEVQVDYFVEGEVATYEVSIESDVEIVATGTLVKVEEIESGNKFSYRARLVRGFGFCVVPPSMRTYEYILEEGTRLVVYTDKQMEMERFISRVQEAFSYYTQYMGSYPYEQMTIVDISGLRQAMSYPMLFMTNFNQMQRVYDKMYSEISKQWVPFVVCNEVGEDNWINSGLSSYLSYRATRSVEEIKNFIGYQETCNQEELYKNQVLEPMHFLVQLEEKLGEEKFKGFLRDYYKHAAFMRLNANDFMKMAIQKYNESVHQVVYILLDEERDK